MTNHREPMMITLMHLAPQNGLMFRPDRREQCLQVEAFKARVPRSAAHVTRPR
jgi:hypothetical protein